MYILEMSQEWVAFTDMGSIIRNIYKEIANLDTMYGGESSLMECMQSTSLDIVTTIF